MIHPDIHAALDRERQNTWLADAEAARAARQARLHRRQAAVTRRAQQQPSRTARPFSDDRRRPCKWRLPGARSVPSMIAAEVEGP